MSIFLYAFVIAFLILFPNDTAFSAREAMRIWGFSIVPILFPYMVFCRLLCQSIQTLRLPPVPCVAALSLLGGSPSGAAVIALNAGPLSPCMLYPLCALAGTISPMFILGTIRSWTNYPLLCRSLLLCHWLSAVICAWIVFVSHRFFHDLNDRPATTVPSPFNPIAQSIDAILQVGGCVISFSVLSSIIGKILTPFPYIQPLVHAFLEISGGIHAICRTPFPPTAIHILISAALGFGSLSLLFQNHAMLKPLGIRMRYLLVFSAIRAAISALLMTVFLTLIP